MATPPHGHRSRDKARGLYRLGAAYRAGHAAEWHVSRQLLLDQFGFDM